VQRTTPFHPSIVLGAGGVVCTAYDLYCFANYFFHSNRFSEKIREKMTSKQAQVATDYFYGYGWWLGTSTIASCDFITHGGQQNGYKSELWYYPRHDIIIVLLSNVRYNEGEWGYEPKRPYIDGLKNNIVRIILQLPATTPQKSFTKELSRSVLKYGIDSALTMYREIRRRLPKEYYFSEMEMNMLGYNYYKIKHDFGTARAILLQNISDYPNSYNVYDTMGWLYDQIEDKVQARAWYLKGLEVYEKYPEENKQWIKDVKKAQERFKK
jgi:CubicO group peptidase (beta-lactamase class C family)